MSELQVFKNDEFGKVRTMIINGEPWFVGKDVAEILGYSNPSKALADHIDTEDKLNNESLSSLGQRGGWLINESGLYSLILSSKLESAKKFKRWVTSEILPSIRKHGDYMTEQALEKALTSPDFIIQLATKLKDEQEKRKSAEKKVEEQNILIHNQNFEIKNLTDLNKILSEDTINWDYKALINSLVRTYAANTDGNFRKAWKEFKKELLYKHSININERITNYLNTSGEKIKPPTLDMLCDSELHKAAGAIVAMCIENNIDVPSLQKFYKKEAA